MYNNMKGLKRLGHSLKSILPERTFRFILKVYHNLLALVQEPLSWYALWRVNRTIARIQRNDRPLRFCFYVVLPSMFHWRRVFELMQKDERFDPFIVVTPRIGWQVGDMEATVEKAFASLVSDYGEKYVFKGYHDGIFDNHIVDCDACAMMNLYSGLADGRFEVFNLALHGVPVFGSNYSYFPGTRHTPEYFGMRSLRFVRRFFCSNETELEVFVKYQKLRKWSDRVEISGSPQSDAIKQGHQNKTRKSILISPHHSVIPTVDSGLCLGNFLNYKDLFAELPRIYPDVDWILRPHPHLKINLIKNVGWTEAQWNDYLGNFLANPNATYEDDGPYYESFWKSDAIIHDCGSFLPEYFYTGKPTCYMLASKESKNYQFINWGIALIDHTYQAYSKDDIMRFIEDVVINGKDPMEEERQAFAREKIMVNYPHASQHIVDSIAELLGRDKKGAS